MTEKAEKIDRKQSNALDKILGKPLKVLNDGFVRVIDYMGTDESIVQAARVSYGAGTKAKNTDRQLLRYLIRHQHTSPFEMCELKLHIRVPMDCWRQWIRHRTANVNEYSTRYSIAIDSTYNTKPDEWRMQAINNKQGSDGFLDLKQGKTFTKEEKELHARCVDIYNNRVAAGVAREQARKDLPLSTYTEAYWKIDLHNLLRFLMLRMDDKAQLEIREYANTIGQQIVKKWCPFTWEAFEDYWLESTTLSKFEQNIIAAINTGKPKEATNLAIDANLIEDKPSGYQVRLEGLECEAKLKKMGFAIPWN